MKTPKTFALPFPLYLALLLANGIVALWLDSKTGSAWLLNAGNFEHLKSLNFPEIAGLAQTALFAVTLDMSIRSLVVSLNKRRKKTEIPAVVVQFIILICYGLIGLYAYVTIYDKSYANLVAASGMAVLGLVYAFREALANTLASIQIQTEGLVSINDWIEVVDVTPSEVFQVLQIDYQMITLLNVNRQHVRVPNRQFISYKYINLSKQPITKGVLRKLRLEVTNATPSSQAIQILGQAMESVLEENKSFYAFVYCLLVEIKSGIYVYEIKYEVDPAISRPRSDDIVNKAAIRFLLAGGANLNYTVEVSRADVEISFTKKRLLAIKEFGILKDLSDTEIDLLSQTVTVSRFKGGENIISYQDKSHSMFILLEGCIEVNIPKGDNESVKVATLWPGSCVGEMSLVTGESRSADVIAVTESLLLEISKKDITPILEKNPRLVEQMAELLASRQAHIKNALSPQERLIEKRRLFSSIAQRIKNFIFSK